MALGVPPPDSVIKEGIFIQPLTPIGNSLIGSFFVGIIPLIVVLVLLGAFRVPAYYAAFSGLFTCIFIAIFGWHMPPQQAFEAIGYGIVYANWPIMWIVVNAMYLYNITIRSGVFHLFRKWMISNTPPDKRVLLLIISFCFGSLLEGVAGFGVPGAICSSLLVSLGFDPIDAIVYTLLFNTTPVAFGSLGTPVATLAALTELPLMSLSAMMGRQLPFVSVFLPAYTLTIYAGFREGLFECWPVALVSGLVFATVQAVFANWVGPELPDLIAGLLSLICTMGFVQYWKPPYRAKYKANMDFLFANDESLSCSVKQSEKINSVAGSDGSDNLVYSKKDAMMAEHQDNSASESSIASSEDVATKKSDRIIQQGDTQSRITVATTADHVYEKASWKETGLAWSPWAFVVGVVMIWSFAKITNVGQINVQWPHLHQQVWLTLYGKKYDAIWGFQPLAIGTAILVSTVPFSAIVMLNGAHPRIFPTALRDTAIQLYRPTITVSLIMAFAYLLNYSGIVYTIGYQLSSVGRAFPFLSAWLGWIACFLSGSDTSANSLFGNLQVVAAREIGLSTILMAATNSAGAITSKMVSPQNLTTGVSTIGLQGKEGQILRRTIIHSVGMCCIMGAMACIQQYLLPEMIPAGG
ncbi:lactate permease [Parasitella parasitica]|nr:lactate permease [Parasitella parasitica]